MNFGQETAKIAT